MNHFYWGWGWSSICWVKHYATVNLLLRVNLLRRSIFRTAGSFGHSKINSRRLWLFLGSLREFRRNVPTFRGRFLVFPASRTSVCTTFLFKNLNVDRNADNFEREIFRLIFGGAFAEEFAEKLWAILLNSPDPYKKKTTYIHSAEPLDQCFQACFRKLEKAVAVCGMRSGVPEATPGKSRDLVARAIRNAIRANRFAIETPIFIARQADSRESLEFPIRTNHLIRANRFARTKNLFRAIFNLKTSF